MNHACVFGFVQWLPERLERGKAFGHLPEASKGKTTGCSSLGQTIERPKALGRKSLGDMWGKEAFKSSCMYQGIKKSQCMSGSFRKGLRRPYVSLLSLGSTHKVRAKAESVTAWLSTKGISQHSQSTETERAFIPFSFFPPIFFLLALGLQGNFKIQADHRANETDFNGHTQRTQMLLK